MTESFPSLLFIVMLACWTFILVWSTAVYETRSLLLIGPAVGVSRVSTVRLAKQDRHSSHRRIPALPLYMSSPIPSDEVNFIEQFEPFSRHPLIISSLDDVAGGIKLDSSPLVEAEVLNDLSHLASDLAVYITPATSYLRLAAFIGRILSMTSDYVSDYTILPEEFIFQHIMLFTTLGLLIKSIAPILQSSFVQTTEFDDDAYRMLFEPIGVSWIQYKSLRVTCVDWITVDANTVLVNEHEAQAFKPSPILENATFASELGNLFRDSQEMELLTPSFNNTDYMYWLYRGHVSVSYDGKKYYEVTRTRGKYIDDPEALGFLADMRFLYMIDRNRRRKRLMELRHINTKTKARHTSYESHSSASQSWKGGYPMATITVKNSEAVLLRVNGSRLLQMMEDDEPLSASVRLLLMMSLQRKIGALLRTGKDQKNMNDLVSATDRLVFQERSYKDDYLSPDYFS